MAEKKKPATKRRRSSSRCRGCAAKDQEIRRLTAMLQQSIASLAGPERSAQQAFAAALDEQAPDPPEGEGEAYDPDDVLASFRMLYNRQPGSESLPPWLRNGPATNPPPDPEEAAEHENADG